MGEDRAMTKCPVCGKKQKGWCGDEICPVCKVEPITIVEEVKRWLDAIQAESGDDEAAHSDQDALLVAVLRGMDNPVAAEARKVLDIKFSRWYA